ncbi:hypothetical protein KBZ21_40870, partial [Streptomyces sp. A73]|nr:hypothetical protein [Streptomyces sp. A73]
MRDRRRQQTFTEAVDRFYRDVLERDEDGQVPTVGQFTAHDPQTYTKIIDLYARIMATQLGLPP